MRAAQLQSMRHETRRNTKQPARALLTDTRAVHTDAFGTPSRQPPAR
jgi:hypothetical protein